MFKKSKKTSLSILTVASILIVSLLSAFSLSAVEDPFAKVGTNLISKLGVIFKNYDYPANEQSFSFDQTAKSITAGNAYGAAAYLSIDDNGDNTLGLAADASYVIEATQTITAMPLSGGAGNPADGVRFIFRATNSNNYLSIAFFDGNVHLLKKINGALDIIASTNDDFHDVNKPTILKVYSTPTIVTIKASFNGSAEKILFDNVTVPSLNAGIGLYAENATGKVESLSVIDMAEQPISTPTPTPTLTPSPSPANPLVRPDNAINYYLSANKSDFPNGAGDVVFADDTATLSQISQGGKWVTMDNGKSSLNIKKEGKYVFSGSVKTTSIETSALGGWGGPRLIFRANDEGNFIAIGMFQGAVHMLANTVQNGNYVLGIISSNGNVNLFNTGEFVDFKIYSTPTTVTVYLNDQLVFDNFNLPSTYSDGTNSYDLPQLDSIVGIYSANCSYNALDLDVYTLTADGNQEVMPSTDPTTTNPTPTQGSDEPTILEAKVQSIVSVDGGEFSYSNGIFSVEKSENESTYLFDTDIAINKTKPYSMSFKAKFNDYLAAAEDWNGFKVIVGYNDANNFLGLMLGKNGTVLPVALKNGGWVNLSDGYSFEGGFTVGMTIDVKVVVDGNNMDVYIDDEKVTSATFTDSYVAKTGIRTSKAGLTFSNITIETIANAGSPNTGDQNNIILMIILVMCAATITLTTIGKYKINT